MLKHFPPSSLSWFEACTSRRFVWGSVQTLDVPQLDSKWSCRLMGEQQVSANYQQKVHPTGWGMSSGGRWRQLGRIRKSRSANHIFKLTDYQLVVLNITKSWLFKNVTLNKTSESFNDFLCFKHNLNLLSAFCHRLTFLCHLSLCGTSRYLYFPPQFIKNLLI